MYPINGSSTINFNRVREGEAGGDTRTRLSGGGTRKEEAVTAMLGGKSVCTQQSTSSIPHGNSATALTKARISTTDEAKQEAPQGGQENEFTDLFNAISSENRIYIAKILDNCGDREEEYYQDKLSKLFGGCYEGSESVKKIFKHKDLFLQSVGPISITGGLKKKEDTGFRERPISFHDDDPRILHCLLKIRKRISSESASTLIHLCDGSPCGKYTTGTEAFSNIVCHNINGEDDGFTLETLMRYCKDYGMIFAVDEIDKVFNNSFNALEDVKKNIALFHGKKYLSFISQTYKQLSDMYGCSDDLEIIFTTALKAFFEKNDAEKTLYLTHRIFDYSIPENQEIIDKALRLFRSTKNKTGFEWENDWEPVKNQIIDKFKTSHLVPISRLFEVIGEIGLSHLLSESVIKKTVELVDNLVG